MNEFIELVDQMRMHQKEYFRTRDAQVLQRCKKLEREVDDFIRRSADNIEAEVIREPEHPTLF